MPPGWVRFTMILTPMFGTFTSYSRAIIPNLWIGSIVHTFGFHGGFVTVSSVCCLLQCAASRSYRRMSCASTKMCLSCNAIWPSFPARRKKKFPLSSPCKAATWSTTVLRRGNRLLSRWYDCRRLLVENAGFSNQVLDHAIFRVSYESIMHVNVNRPQENFWNTGPRHLDYSPCYLELWNISPQLALLLPGESSKLFRNGKNGRRDGWGRWSWVLFFSGRRPFSR